MAKAIKVKKAVKVTEEKLEDIDIDMMTAINAAGMLYIDPANSKVCVNMGLVETNSELRDAKGNYATRLTEKGKLFIMSNTSKVENTPAMPAHNFTIAAFDALAVVKREHKARGRAAKYPIDALQVGQMFFVPNTEKTPDAVKSLTGTLQAANKKYAKPTGEMREVTRKVKGVETTKQVAVTVAERQFKVVPYLQNGVNGAAFGRVV